MIEAKLLIIKKILAAMTALITLLTAVPIPKFGAVGIEMQWLNSYETVLFDTADGDLDFNQYAVYQNICYVRTKPKETSQFENIGCSLVFNGLNKVNVIGKTAYNVFKDNNGKIYREKSNKQEYDSLKGNKKPVKYQPISFLNLFRINEAYAAVTFDAVTTGNRCASCSSLTYAHTVTGSDPVLVVNVGCEVQVASCLSMAATYNAVSLVSRVGPTSAPGSELFSLRNPATGSNNVVITPTGQLAELRGDSMSFTGADVTTATSHVGTTCSLSDVGNPMNCSLTSVASIDMMSYGLFTPVSGSCAPQSGETERYDSDNAASHSCGGTQTGSGNVTLSINGGTGSDMVAMNIIAPVVAASSIKRPDIIWFSEE